MVPIAPGLYATLRDYVLARSTLNPRDFLAQVPNCVPHRFRHLFATDLLRQGPTSATSRRSSGTRG